MEITLLPPFPSLYYLGATWISALMLPSYYPFHNTSPSHNQSQLHSLCNNSTKGGFTRRLSSFALSYSPYIFKPYAKVRETDSGHLRADEARTKQPALFCDVKRISSNSPQANLASCSPTQSLFQRARQTKQVIVYSHSLSMWSPCQSTSSTVLCH